jgi:hypothetical protein
VIYSSEARWLESFGSAEAVRPYRSWRRALLVDVSSGVVALGIVLTAATVGAGAAAALGLLVVLLIVWTSGTHDV